MQWLKGEPVDLATMKSSLAISLKLAKFRPTRGTQDSDEVCARAAEVILKNFERSGFVVVHAEDKLMRTSDQFPSCKGEPQQPYKRCEGCED